MKSVEGKNESNRFYQQNVSKKIDFRVDFDDFGVKFLHLYLFQQEPSRHSKSCDSKSSQAKVSR